MGVAGFHVLPTSLRRIGEAGRAAVGRRILETDGHPTRDLGFCIDRPCPAHFDFPRTAIGGQQPILGGLQVGHDGVRDANGPLRARLQAVRLQAARKSGPRGLSSGGLSARRG